MISFLAFAIPLALYVAWPSTLWNFDGVACAAALELGQPTYFFHANHLWYGFLGYGFWKWIAAPCGVARSLPALQLFTSMAAALGLVGLYRVVDYETKNEWSALLLTVALGVTAAFWTWSVEAQVYSLGILPLAWATYILLYYRGPQKYLWVGLLHAAAVLGHLMHFLWAVPAIFWMWGDRPNIRRYVIPLLLGTMIPYALVLMTVIAPGRDLTRVLIWLKGSAALTPNKSWAWHWSGILGPWIWLKSTMAVLWGTFAPYGGVSQSVGIWGLTALSIGLLLWIFLRGLPERGASTARFAWIWIVTYGVFLSTWEPATLCYRMPDVIPIGILLALGLKTWRGSKQIALAGLLLGSLFTVNWVSQIGPMHDASRNQVYQDVLSLSKMTSPKSLYITQGGPTWIYLLYFTGRTAWNAKSFPPDKLKAEIAQQKRLHPVYVLDGTKWKRVP